jgi:hypothetical protein
MRGAYTSPKTPFEEEKEKGNVSEISSTICHRQPFIPNGANGSWLAVRNVA